MQLKYHDDIKWQDLPKIERPSFAQSTIKNELSRPWPRLQKGIFKDPLSDIYQNSRREVDPNAVKRLLRKVEEGSVLLVHTFEENVSYPAFIWKKDDNHPDKGRWTLSEQLYSASEYHFNLLLDTVKKPRQRGSVKTVATATTEYGYISSSNSNATTQTLSTGVGETTIDDAAKTLGQFLYKAGSRTVILATLAPRTAGGTTTYAIANQPDIRIIESDLEPARYQRRVDGEWQTTGIQAIQVVDEGRVMGFEALSPEEAASLKSTGGIPIAPQAKPTIEGSPPDNPPDSSRLVFPDQQGQIDSSKLSFPAEGPGPMASPGFNQGTDARDVVGSSVMYNENKNVEGKNFFKEVEIVDSRGSPIGEFDEIDLKNSIFYEDKSAKGLSRLNPRTGLPAQTPEQFTDKQLYQKTSNRIKNLQGNDVTTRATKGGTQTVPSIEELKDINKFVFRLDADTPELRSASNNSLDKLRLEYPDYSFNATFGGKK